MPLAALALLVVFGSVIAAGVPLVVGGSSVLVALGAIYLVASVTPMSIFVLNLATLLGLGLGVDYSLLLTSRFREELAKRPADGTNRVHEAVRLTVATPGRAVFFSGLTVLLGLLGLVLFEFMILRSVGIAGAIVVGLAVLAALTLLPALLALFGQHLDRLAIRRVSPRPAAEGPWARLARRVMRRPLAVLIPTLAVLLLLGYPFLHVRFNAPDASILPPDVPSRAAFDRLREAFGEGEFAPIVVAIRTDGPAASADNLARLFDYSRRIGADPRVSRLDSLVDVDPRMTLAQYQLLYGDPNGPRDRFLATVLAMTTKDDLTAFTITTPFGPNRDQGRDLVRDLRAADGPLAAPAGTSILVGGGAADVADVVDGVAADFPRTAIFIIVTTYLVLLRTPPLGDPAREGAPDERVVDHGELRRTRLDLPGRQSVGPPRLPAGRVRRDDPAGHPVLRPVRAVDGLRGLPPVADEGGLGHDRRQHRGRRARPRAERSDRHLGRAHRGGRRRVVRLRRHRPDQGARARRGDRGGTGRDGGPGAARALDDAAARPLELVDAGVARAVRRQSTARVRGRDRSRGGSMNSARRASPSIAALISGCGGDPILANPPAAQPSQAPPTAEPTPAGRSAPDRLSARRRPARSADGVVVLHGPPAVGGRPAVRVRVRRSSGPSAATSPGRGHPTSPSPTRPSQTFDYAQRTEIGPQVDRSPRDAAGEPAGFDLSLSGHRPDRSLDTPAARHGRWAARSPGTTRVSSRRPRSLRIDRDLRRTPARPRLDDAPTKPPALHDTDGWIDFGPAGGSYYYSRTALEAAGTLYLGSDTIPVDGIAWFDHQWGDFITVGGGGWDWFAINLEDGTDITLSQVRDVDGSYPLVYGTIVDARGTTRHLERDDFTIETTQRWTSPKTGATYPAAWHITLPGEGLVIDLVPSVADQELDTRASTGVVYWEGSQLVSARRALRGRGYQLGGEAYVELTGYAPAGLAP